MALTADGKVFSWGDGEMGQLGHGDNQWVYIHLENLYTKYHMVPYVTNELHMYVYTVLLYEKAEGSIIY